LLLEVTMSDVFRYPSLLRCAAAAVFVAMASSQVVAAADPSSEAQIRYRQEMAQCNSGKSSQDAANCRLEARNAREAARKGALSAPGVELQDNAQQRCKVHQGVDRSACEARMRGEGAVEGSVGGGGVLREKAIIVPGS
jgi:hypothetical protein